jgi:hypothetical protein
MFPNILISSLAVIRNPVMHYTNYHLMPRTKNLLPKAAAPHFILQLSLCKPL